MAEIVSQTRRSCTIRAPWGELYTGLNEIDAQCQMYHGWAETDMSNQIRHDAWLRINKDKDPSLNPYRGRNG